MSAHEQKSGLLAKLGDRLNKAVEAHKGDETERGQVGLPPGIRGGIAQVVRVWFDTYKQGDNLGKTYFMAQASVIEPEVHVVGKRTYRTRGLHTTVGPEPLCDTPSRQNRPRFEDHVAWVLNIFRIMGVDTASLEGDDIGTALEQIAEDLSNPENPPVYIKFDTFQFEPDEQNPNPRINHKWVDTCDPSEVSVDTSPDGGVEQAPPRPTGPAKGPTNKPQANGHATPPKKPTGPVQRTPAPTTRVGQGMAAAAKKTAPATAGTKTPTRPAGKKAAPAPEPEPDNYSENEEIEALIQQAEDGDEAARDALSERAQAVGFTEDQVTNAPSWTDLGQALMSGDDPASFEWEAPAEDQTSEPEPPAGPQVEEVYFYKPVDPRTKKPAAKAVEVVVTAVNEADETADLKNNNNPRQMWKKVPWASLMAEA